MKMEILRERASLDPLADEWNPLLERSRANTVFLTWEFISSWLDVVAPEVEPYVVTVRDDAGRLLAIAPFYLSRARFMKFLSYRCLCLLGDQASASEYLDIIVDRDHEAEVLEELGRYLAAQTDWDCIWMTRLSGWSGTVERMELLCTAGGFQMNRRTRPFSSILLPDTIDAYLERFSSKTRYQFRRGRKQLDSSGVVRFRACRTRDEVPEFVAVLEELHQKHWLDVGDPGAFGRNPRFRRFLEVLCPRVLDRGWLGLSGIEVDGRMVAIQFGLVYDGVFNAIQEGFDPAYTAVTEGVGNVLRLEIIRECIEAGLREYDFLGGETWHKLRWKAEPRKGYDVFIGRESLKNAPIFRRTIWPTGRYLRLEAVGGRAGAKVVEKGVTAGPAAHRRTNFLQAG
jgi:CelD/BcsL family acetyltransferase involved in cellulose biosynthesis